MLTGTIEQHEQLSISRFKVGLDQPDMDGVLRQEPVRQSRAQWKRSELCIVDRYVNGTMARDQCCLNSSYLDLRPRLELRFVLLDLHFARFAVSGWGYYALYCIPF